MSASALSRRGAALLGEAPALVRAHFACARDAYDPARNAGGYVNLGTAENHLLWPVLAPRLNAPPSLTASDTHYQDMAGTARFRAAFARALELEGAVGAPVDPAGLVTGAGSSTLLEALAFALGDPGDGVLVPAPAYPGFDGDLGARAGLRVVPAPLASEHGYALSVPALAAALAGERAAGRAVRALLLTSPHNPTGRVYARDELEAAVRWALDEGLHVVSDELYAASVYGPRPFTSALALAVPRPERVHALYGFAKDFGLSGFKVGAAYTRCPELLAALRAQALFTPVSTHTQATLAALLEDEPFVATLRAFNRGALAAAAERTRAALAAVGVSCAPADAGLFLWVDLRAHLGAASGDAGPSEGGFARERALHERLLREHRVNLPPGAAFHSAEPGYFRLCFAQDPAHLDEGLARLARALAG